GTGLEPGIDNAVRARFQRTADPGAALAWRLVAGGTIGLLALRRRERRIVGGLLWPLERGQPLLQFSDAGKSRVQLADQRQPRADQRILFRVAQRAEVGPGRHPDVESSRP